MTLGVRLRAKLAENGLSQSELARRVHVSQGTISDLLSGKSSGSSHLHKIARQLGTTPAFLTGETDDASLGALPAPTPEIVAEQLDLVPVEELSLEYGMGATFLTDEVETVRRYFPREWIEHFSTSPPGLLRFARGRGDSMYPTINSGDLVLIDMGQTRMTSQDEIWAVGYGETVSLKRLRLIAGGQIRVMSDAAQVSDEIVTVDELRIVGRVCGTLRKL